MTTRKGSRLGATAAAGLLGLAALMLIGDCDDVRATPLGWLFFASDQSRQARLVVLVACLLCGTALTLAAMWMARGEE